MLGDTKPNRAQVRFRPMGHLTTVQRTPPTVAGAKFSQIVSGAERADPERREYDQQKADKHGATERCEAAKPEPGRAFILRHVSHRRRRD